MALVTIMCLLIVFFTPGRPAMAAQGKTIDVLMVLGARGSEHWRQQDMLKVQGKEVYFTTGLIFFMARAPQAAPLDVIVSARGISDMAFFEPTPLWDLFEKLGSADELRGALLRPNPS